MPALCFFCVPSASEEGQVALVVARVVVRVVARVAAVIYSAASELEMLLSF